MGTHSLRPSILLLGLFVGVAANVMVDTRLKGQLAPSVPTLTNPLTVDDSDPGFFDSTFKTIITPSAYKGEFRYMQQSAKLSAAPVARWTFLTGVTPGIYNIYASWVPFNNINKATTYTILSENPNRGLTPTILSTTTVTVDQTIPPNDAQYASVKWKKIATVTVTNGEVQIMTTATKDVTMLDGMAMQLVPQSSDSSVAVSSVTSTSSASAPACAPIICPNKMQFPTCTERGMPLSYLVNPCAVASSSAPAMSSTSSASAQVVTLQSIVVSGNQVVVNYTKNFDTCAHILDKNKQIVHASNYFCAPTGPITAPLSDFNALFVVGHSYVLCNGNNATICSASVVVTQTPASSAASSAQSSSSSSIITNPVSSSAPSVASSASSIISSAASSSSVAPVSTATLTIAEQNIGANDTAVSNQKGIPVEHFEARAGTDADVVLQSITFAKNATPVIPGITLPDQTFSLMIDTDHDGVVDTLVEKGTIVGGNSIVFGGMNIVIPKASTVALEVQVDIPSHSSDTFVTVGFPSAVVASDTTLSGPLLQGTQTNGVCVTGPCHISVSTVIPKYLTVDSNGSLYITRDQQPRQRQLLGSTLNDEVLRLQLRTTVEPVDVTGLQFNSSGSVAQSVDSLELYKTGETTPFAIATSANCGTDAIPTGVSQSTAFCTGLLSNQQLVVPKGMTQIISIRPRMKSDDNGGISNEPIQLFVTKQRQSDNGPIHARGVISTDTLTANNGDGLEWGEVFVGTENVSQPNADIVSPNNRSVLSKITAIANANPDPDNTSVPTGIYPLGQFKFTAATNANVLNGLNKATLSGIILNVNASNVLLSATSFKLYRTTDSSSKSTCATFTANGNRVTGYASGSVLVQCNGLMNSAVDTRLAPGTDGTFILEGNVLNAKVSSAVSSLQVSLQNFSNLGMTTYGVSSPKSHIDWIDQDANSVEFKWMESGDTVINSTIYRS